VEQHAEVLIGGPWHQRIPTWRDAVATLLVLAIVILLGSGTHQIMGPFVTAQQPRISLSPTALPAYALHTTLRMLAALAASLIFTFTYATPAAKSRRAETAARRGPASSLRRSGQPALPAGSFPGREVCPQSRDLA